METPVQVRTARRHATLAIGLLLAAGFLLRGVAAGLLVWALLFLILYAVASCAWWAMAAWRHRRPDPWAYDPELDGPVAQAMEGRSYLRTGGARPPPARHAARHRIEVAGAFLLAVLFLLAGAWLAQVAGQTWRDGNGAEAPTLSALAFALFAIVFLVAAPWLAWSALRRPR